MSTPRQKNAEPPGIGSLSTPRPPLSVARTSDVEDIRYREVMSNTPESCGIFQLHRPRTIFVPLIPWDGFWQEVFIRSRIIRWLARNGAKPASAELMQSRPPPGSLGIRDIARASARQLGDGSSLSIPWNLSRTFRLTRLGDSVKLCTRNGALAAGRNTCCHDGLGQPQTDRGRSCFLTLRRRYVLSNLNSGSTITVRGQPSSRSLTVMRMPVKMARSGTGAN